MSDFPSDIFTEPQSYSVNTLEQLGPLTGLAGIWEGIRGLDIKPKAEGPKKQAYVERIELRGYTRSGETHLYRHFSAPLKDWVSAQKIERIEAVKTGTAQTEEVVAGLRTHLIASITNPIDAGYFALHAPVRAA